jgi:mannose-6-phosphate isomerase-like protein (cupin superfamily)
VFKVETVKVSASDDLSSSRYLKENPLKTDKMIFNVYSFRPWQALPVHRHPRNEEVFFVVSGEGIFIVDRDEMSVGPSTAVYVPATSVHSILSAENDLKVISVQGPAPIESIYLDGFKYECPVCSLDTPVTTGSYDGCHTICPRCSVKLRLSRDGDRFRAGKVTGDMPVEANVQ